MAKTTSKKKQKAHARHAAETIKFFKSLTVLNLEPSQLRG